MSLKPSPTTVRHILILVAVAVLVRLLMVFIVVTVPFEDFAALLNMPSEVYTRNWRVLNMSYDDRPLAKKLGYTFDSKWYVDIAGKGYRVAEEDLVYMGVRLPGGSEGKCIYSWLFIYPLFIRLFSALMDRIIAGLLVANLASITATTLFYIVALDYLKPDAALKAGMLFTLYPYNILGMASFSDSLYVVFTLLAWMLFRRRGLVGSGLSMMLASLTRYPGLILFPVFTLIHLRRELGKSRVPHLIRDALTLNVFSIPILYWMFIHIPQQTGYTQSGIGFMCWGLRFMPGGAILNASFIGLLFSYFALIAVYYLKNVDGELMIYAGVFMLFHLSLIGGGMALGRYIGVIWPLFIYYGGRVDSNDACFFSFIFIILGALMVLLHTYMVSWV